MNTLTDAELTKILEDVDGPDWQLISGKLMKSVKCTGFLEALAFVGNVGTLAEEANHHPDIDIRYSRVTLALITHDSDGITNRDINLAKAIDRISVT